MPHKFQNELTARVGAKGELNSLHYANALVRMVWVTTSVWLCMALVATGEVSHALAIA